MSEDKQKSGIYAMFQTNADFETDGIEVEYGENSKGVPIVFRIARAGGRNVRFTKALDKATKPFRKIIQTGMLSDKQANDLYQKVFCETVLLGWSGVEDESGEDMEFSVDNALKLFSDLPDLFADLRDQATTAALFREELRKEDLGNSGPSLNTGSNKGQSNKK